MNKKIKLKNLDCAECASELEEILSKIKGVEQVSVDFIQQMVFVSINNEQAFNDVINACNSFEEVEVVKTEKARLRITGLDCVNCAQELKEKLMKIDGIKEAEVDFVNQIVHLEYENIGALNQATYVCNNFEDVKVISEEKRKISKTKISLLFIIISAIIFIAAIITERLNFAGSKYISLCLYIISYLFIGYSVLAKTFKNIIHGIIFDENFLMSIASIGAMIISEMIEGVAVMLLYQIGELLQTIAVNSSRNSIVDLMDLQSETASLIVGEEIKVVPPESLNIGDIILIKNGEKVPVDCTIIDGESAFDTKSLTGEALLKELGISQTLLSGYINKGAIVKAKVINKYENSAVSKILELVENSSSKKADPEKFITKFARIYTPIVCVLAFIVAIVIPIIISTINGDWDNNFRVWVYHSLTLLVISCPCALIISVPLTYFGGLGACAKKGVLVKGATYLDLLTKISIAAFDKTGTLTEGSFKIQNVKSYYEEDILKIASSFEINSNHPLAKAFKNYKAVLPCTEVEEISGKGIVGKIDNRKYYVGNYKLIKSYHPEFDEVESISTIIYVADEEKVLGYIEIDDSLKENTLNALKKMRQCGVNKLVMLTGDNNQRAKYVSKILELDNYYAELLPDQKLQKALKLKEEGKLLYIGDGINDAPVMVIADCAVSMGKIGSDAAIEASDIVLISDELEDVVTSIKIAKKTRKIVLENIIFSISMKILFMLLGVLGLIPLIAAVFSDVGVMLLAVINSLRMKINIK